MGFLDSFTTIRLCDVEKTIKNALDNGYNAHIVINGETYLIKEGDLNE